MKDLVRNLEILAETTELWIKDIKDVNDDTIGSKMDISFIKEKFNKIIEYFFKKKSKLTYKSK